MRVSFWKTGSIPDSGVVKVFRDEGVSYHCLIKLEDYEKHTFELGEDEKDNYVNEDFISTKNKLGLSVDNYDEFIKEVKDKIDNIIRATFEV